MREPVTNKIMMYDRWIKGEFGNRLACFQTYQEYLDSGFKGRIGIRYKEAASPYCKYNIEPCDVKSVYDSFINQGADPALLTFGEAANDTKVTFQGEILQSVRSYELFYSNHKSQMRIALATEPNWAYGIKALELMKIFVDYQSLEDIKELLENYVNCVVEFSSYECNVGNCPNRNTLIWEVRSTY